MIRRPAQEKYKCGVIFYHKGLKNKYKQHWMEKCVHSIEAQTYTEFDVFELNYGDDLDTLKDLIGRPTHFSPQQQHVLLFKPFDNHIEAMNYLLDYLFKHHHYDIIFNTNLDDSYHQERFVKQINAVASGYDLVSSNFMHFKEDGPQTKLVHMLKFDDLNIKDELSRDHNVLCHPVIAYTKNFWSTAGPYENKLQVEDLLLWKKALNLNLKITVLPEFLCYYLIHPQQITAQNRQ